MDVHVQLFDVAQVVREVGYSVVLAMLGVGILWALKKKWESTH